MHIEYSHRDQLYRRQTNGVWAIKDDEKWRVIFKHEVPEGIINKFKETQKPTYEELANALHALVAHDKISDIREKLDNCFELQNADELLKRLY